MSYPRNPLVRRKTVSKQFDWARIEKDLHLNFPIIESGLKVFLERNPFWGGNAWKGSYPPCIDVWLYLKSQAYPRRKLTIGSDIGPERMAVIPPEELDRAAALIAEMLKKCLGCKVKLGERDGMLMYEFKVADMNRYRK